MENYISKANNYNDTLCNVLAPACKQEIKRLYTKVTLDPANKLIVLRAFQEELARIKDRSYEQFDEWFNYIMESKNMFWLSDLMKKVVFELCIVCGVRDDKVPEVDPVLLVKTCLINSARELWKQPYLLYDKYNRYEYSQNMSTFDTLVKASVVRSIHDTIPKVVCHERDDVQSELVELKSVRHDIISDVESDDASVASCCFSVVDASDLDHNEQDQM
eukprot:gene19660-26346_t